MSDQTKEGGEMKTITLTEARQSAYCPDAITDEDVGRLGIMVDGDLCDLARAEESDPIAAYRERNGLTDGETDATIELVEIVEDAGTEYRPEYCTQPRQAGKGCETCSLTNYGRDCQNNPVEAARGEGMENGKERGQLIPIEALRRINKDERDTTEQREEGGEMSRRGLTCSVYRARGFEACGLGGISETADRVLLVGEGVEGPTTEADAAQLGYPVVVLDRRTVCGSPYLTARPADMPHGMMGGAFVYTCDSRFPSPYPIPLHDRAVKQC